MRCDHLSREIQSWPSMYSRQTTKLIVSITKLSLRFPLACKPNRIAPCKPLMLFLSPEIWSELPTMPQILPKTSFSGYGEPMFDTERARQSRGAESGTPQPLNPTIFILEHDPDIAGLLKHHLQPAGYGVSWFPTSAGFLDEMHARRPALVILDIMVPGNSGLDIAKSIRGNTALVGTPIVF